ncbi:MAG: FAD-dependent oxidoreductase, partial [Calditrichaeota bacterium]
MDEAVVQSAANRPGTRTEVLVVGGGVIGLSCAYYLSRAGLQVTVVDREPPEQRCSWGNAGLIVPSHFVPLASPGIVARGLRWLMNPDSPFYIQPRFNRSLFSWLWAFR